MLGLRAVLPVRPLFKYNHIHALCSLGVLRYHLRAVTIEVRDQSGCGV